MQPVKATLWQCSCGLGSWCQWGFGGRSGLQAVPAVGRVALAGRACMSGGLLRQCSL